MASEFNVGKSTITDIKKSEHTLISFSGKLESEEGGSSRKTMKTAYNDKLDSAIYTWFVQQRSKGEPISGPIICEKALIMNEKLGGDSHFKATSGWLQKLN